MAQIKFNRGLRSNLSSSTNTDNDIAFIADSGTNWDSIYLGTALVGTSLLGLMKPSKLKRKATDAATSWTDVTIGTGTGNLSSVVITADYVSSTTGAITTCRKLVDYAGAGANGYTPGDNELLTAKAVKRIADAAAAGVDIDTWYSNFTQSTWTWTALNAGGTDHDNLSFTLPVTSTFDGHTNNTEIPTTQAVSDWFGNLVGAMEYKGQLTPAIASGTHSEAYKKGDVFVAVDGVAVSGVRIEEGDMVIVKDDIAANTAFTSAKIDIFERNLDGAVTTTNPLAANQLIVGNGTKTITTLDTTAGGLVYSSAANTVANLQIGTTNQHLIVKDTGLPGWADSIYYKVALKPNTSSGGVTTYHDDTLVITQNKNGQDQTSAAVELQINHVAEATHASSADTATNATHAEKVKMAENSSTSYILVRGAASSASGFTDNYGVNYESSATVTTDGAFAGKNITLTQSSTSIDVFDTLTWHTLGS